MLPNFSLLLFVIKKNFKGKENYGNNKFQRTAGEIDR